ncbi:unnamed protein product [Citrullus colocynthis]|uniref:Trichome birefringence-like C-terminal domain-containing protein n=1 Tax=Citrullus colocynthis TaxID=252529 RepID=A0ABP0YCA7_9ROSI
MRRKRIMLVGDSIMRNQWESLVCLVQGVVPMSRKIVTYNGPSMAFHALDLETSIEFPWAPLLVELNKGAENKRVLHLDRIEENAKYWTTVDTCFGAVAPASGSIEKDEISSIPPRHHSNVGTSKRWPPLHVPEQFESRREAAPGSSNIAGIAQYEVIRITLLPAGVCLSLDLTSQVSTIILLATG